MIDKIDMTLASSEQIEAVLCAQVRRMRLARNITQAQLADEAGVSLPTIGRLESGKGITLDTFIRVLTALGVQQNLEGLLPDPTVRPVERTSASGKERTRARPSQSTSEPAAWTWGDDRDSDE